MNRDETHGYDSRAKRDPDVDLLVDFIEHQATLHGRSSLIWMAYPCSGRGLPRVFVPAGGRGKRDSGAPPAIRAGNGFYAIGRGYPLATSQAYLGDASYPPSERYLYPRFSSYGDSRRTYPMLTSRPLPDLASLSAPDHPALEGLGEWHQSPRWGSYPRHPSAPRWSSFPYPASLPSGIRFPRWASLPVVGGRGGECYVMMPLPSPEYPSFPRRASGR